MYQLIIFDFDGTLADTRKSILNTITLTLEKLEHNLPDANEVIKRIGLPLEDTLRGLTRLNQAEIERAVQIYRTIYNETAINTIELFPDVKETLEHIQAKKIAMAIASSKGKKALLKLLDKLQIRDYFTQIIGEADVENKKPAPDMIFKILKKAAIKAKHVLMVGDTEYDLQMGRNAGCDTCFAAYGYGKPAPFPAPVYTINRFRALSSLLNEKK